MKYLIIFIISAYLSAEDFKVLRVNSVYDGDTFKADLKCSTEFFCKNASVRVLGVDTPEMKSKTPESIQAKEFTINFLKDKVQLKDCSKDKYFRIDCNVVNKKGQSLADELIKAGLGYSYDGGTKEVFK